MSTEKLQAIATTMYTAVKADRKLAKEIVALADGVTDPNLLADDLRIIRIELFAMADRSQPAIDRPQIKKTAIDKMAYAVKAVAACFDGGKFTWNKSDMTYKWEEKQANPAAGRQSAADSKAQSEQMVANAQAANAEPVAVEPAPELSLADHLQALVEQYGLQAVASNLAVIAEKAAATESTAMGKAMSKARKTKAA